MQDKTRLYHQIASGTQYQVWLGRCPQCWRCSELWSKKLTVIHVRALTISVKHCWIYQRESQIALQLCGKVLITQTHRTTATRQCLPAARWNSPLEFEPRLSVQHRAAKAGCVCVLVLFFPVSSWVGSSQRNPVGLAERKAKLDSCSSWNLDIFFQAGIHLALEIFVGSHFVQSYKKLSQNLCTHTE